MSEQKDFESRLRDALRADGENAELSPNALGKIRGRLQQPQRERRTARRVIAYGVMAAAAACTAAVIVVPLLSGPAAMQTSSAPGQAESKSGTQYDGESSVQGQVPPAEPNPTPTTMDSQEKSAMQGGTLGELTVGKDLRLMLTYTQLREDAATVTLWAPAGEVVVGKAYQWEPGTAATPKLCEFRVTQAQNKPATVRVRLAQGSGCSALYEYEVDGKTLKPKSS
jgi:hypothetical protein